MRAERPDLPEGDTGFGEFVRQHTPSLFATARLLTGSRETAEDLLQDVLTRLYPRWSTVEAADNPVAYVRRSLVNAYISTTRRAAHHEILADHDTLTALGRDTHGIPDHADAVATAATITPLLAHLSARQRAALVLRYFHDHTDAEIGEGLGCRRGTARSLISRGLQLLRHTLDTDTTTSGGAAR